MTLPEADASSSSVSLSPGRWANLGAGLSIERPWKAEDSAEI